MQTKVQKIKLLGKWYQVRCPLGKEQVLQRSAEYLSVQLQQTQRSSGLTSREDIIMMTALNMCHQQLFDDQ